MRRYLVRYDHGGSETMGGKGRSGLFSCCDCGTVIVGMIRGWRCANLTTCKFVCCPPFVGTKGAVEVVGGTRLPIFTYRNGQVVTQSVLRNEMGFQFVEVYTTTKQIYGKNIEDMLQVRQILLHTCSRCIVFEFTFPPPLQAHKQSLPRGETIVAMCC